MLCTAAGFPSPLDSLYHASQEQVTELHLIGDAREPRKALDAIHDGLEAGMII
jgi:hypothetical protein